MRKILSLLAGPGSSSAIRILVPLFLLFLVILPLLVSFAPQVLQAWKDYQELVRYDYGVKDDKD